MRIPHAAQALADDLGTRYKSVKFEGDGDPDGFGVQRSVRYSGAAGKFLAKVIEAVDDPRIVDTKKHKDGVIVTFSDRTIADQRDSFPLDSAELWLRMQDEQQESSSDDD